MKRILVAGGSGFLGNHLIERLFSMGETNIVAVARNEAALVALKEKFPFIEIQVGDIANRWCVKKAMKDADEIFLLSAMKHVTLSDRDVMSCIATNIYGVENVIMESLNTKPKLLLFVSTDKAGNPIGVYGCTKKIGERLMAEAERINPDTKYRIVRYGNILYSNGSVLCKWKDKMQKGQEVIITNPDATRFFWSISDAVDLIFRCIETSKDSTPLIPSMKSIRLGDLLDAMMEKYGHVSVSEIGLQIGENMHETISENGINSYESERFTKEEILQLI